MTTGGVDQGLSEADRGGTRPADNSQDSRDGTTAPDAGARERWQKRTQTPLAIMAATFFVAYAVPILWPSSSPTLITTCHVVQGLTYLAFVGDYFARMFLSQDRLGFLRHSGLDVVVLALPALQPLRAMQLLTLLRVIDKRIGRTLRGRIIAYLSFATVTVSVVGSLAVLDVERHARGSNIHTFGDALWWATTTITTVGYGEHHPVTAQGRVVAACLMFSGIALLSVVTGAVASWILERMREEEGETAADDRMRSEVDALTEEIRALRADVAALSRERKYPDEAPGNGAPRSRFSGWTGPEPPDGAN